MLVAPRIARRILALAEGDPASARLARDYAAAYGAELSALRADGIRSEGARVAADRIPEKVDSTVPPPIVSDATPRGGGDVVLQILLAPARAPRARRAQLLRRIARWEPRVATLAARGGASSEEGLRVVLPADRAESLRARLASNTEVASAQLAVSDARVG